MVLAKADCQIRGAPAIASLAALTLARQLHLTLAGQGNTFSLESTAAFRDSILPELDYLQSSRPTAVNLGEAMDRIREAVNAQNEDAKALAQSVQKACEAVHSADLQRNRDMGLNGADWLWNLRKDKAGGEGLNVLTVCNTGSLATSVCSMRVTTSLTHRAMELPSVSSPPFTRRAGSTRHTTLRLHVRLDTLNLILTLQLTTRVRSQDDVEYPLLTLLGSRLTSLELTTLQIPSCMICKSL